MFCFTTFQNASFSNFYFQSLIASMIEIIVRRRMSGAEERRGSGDDSGEGDRSREGDRAKSSKSKKEKSKETEKQERSKEREKNKETEQCKAAEEKVTTGDEEAKPASTEGGGKANNSPDSPKKDASTDPLEDAGICADTLIRG